MRREDHVDREKPRTAAAGMELSHDNLFHSIPGLVEIDAWLFCFKALQRGLLITAGSFVLLL